MELKKKNRQAISNMNKYKTAEKVVIGFGFIGHEVKGREPLENFLENPNAWKCRYKVQEYKLKKFKNTKNKLEQKLDVLIGEVKKTNLFLKRAEQRANRRYV